MFQERFKLEKDQPPSGGGRFKAIIDTVIGNLQLSITNVHIRFEVCDDLLLPCNSLIEV